jgi:hypothetical protein
MACRHHIVVSTENNPYAAWQTKLFHYSCVSRLGQLPIVIVHDSGRAWHTDFQDLVRAGAIVRSAPTYRTSLHDDYPPRNTAGTLLHAAELLGGSEGDFIVLCDPDMIFARAPGFPETLSADHYPYMMDYKDAEVRRVAESLGIDLEAPDTQKEELYCGVPYVIPLADARPLGEMWLEAINRFSVTRRGDMMHAFGLAAVKLCMRITLTHMVDHNYWQTEPLKRDVIHYCYGDERWNKRDYFYAEQARKVWEAPTASAPPGSILSEILTQIREARAFYQAPKLFSPASPKF